MHPPVAWQPVALLGRAKASPVAPVLCGVAALGSITVDGEEPHPTRVSAGRGARAPFALDRVFPGKAS